MAIVFSTILNIIFCKYITDSNTSKDRHIDINIIKIETLILIL
jgi:hypothetical protein